MAYCLTEPSCYLNQCWLASSSKVFCGIHLRAISLEVHWNLIHIMCLKITLLKLILHLPWASELTKLWRYVITHDGITCDIMKCCNLNIQGHLRQTSYLFRNSKFTHPSQFLHWYWGSHYCPSASKLRQPWSMISSNGSIFHFIVPLCGELTNHPVNSPHKDQWHVTLMFSWICAWTNGMNNRDAGDLRCQHAHYGITAM